MGISCYVLILKFAGLESRVPTDLWSIHCVLPVPPPEKRGTKMQCLGAALLSVQGVAPVICWNCCEKPPAPNWDTRSHSGQVVLSSPGQLRAPWRLALAKILKKVVIFYTDSCPTPNPFCDGLILAWSHPVPCGDALSIRHSSGLAVGFSKESSVGAGHPQDPRLSQTANFCVFSSASLLTHTLLFLVLFLTSPQ